VELVGNQINAEHSVSPGIKWCDLTLLTILRQSRYILFVPSPSLTKFFAFKFRNMAITAFVERQMIDPT
jgi:hypothetical protein